MNKVFKVVYSTSKQAYVVTSEFAKSHQKTVATVVAGLVLSAHVGGAFAADIDTLDSRLTKVETAVSTINTKLTTVTSTPTHSAQVEENKQAIAKHEETITNQGESLQTLKDQYAALDKLNLEVKNEVEAATATSKANTDTNTTQDSSIAKNARNIEKVHNNVVEIAKELAKQLPAMADDIDHKVEALYHSIGENNKLITDNSNTIKELDKQVKENTSVRDKHTANFVTNNAKIAALEGAVKKHGDTLTKHDTAIVKTQTAVKKLHTAITEIVDQTGEITTALSASIDNNAKMIKTNADSIDRIDAKAETNANALVATTNMVKANTEAIDTKVDKTDYAADKSKITEGLDALTETVKKLDMSSSSQAGAIKEAKEAAKAVDAKVETAKKDLTAKLDEVGLKVDQAVTASKDVKSAIEDLSDDVYADGGIIDSMDKQSNAIEDLNAITTESARQITETRDAVDALTDTVNDLSDIVNGPEDQSKPGLVDTVKLHGESIDALKEQNGNQELSITNLDERLGKVESVKDVKVQTARFDSIDATNKKQDEEIQSLATAVRGNGTDEEPGLVNTVKEVTDVIYEDGGLIDVIDEHSKAITDLNTLGEDNAKLIAANAAVNDDQDKAIDTIVTALVGGKDEAGIAQPGLLDTVANHETVLNGDGTEAHLGIVKRTEHLETDVRETKEQLGTVASAVKTNTTSIANHEEAIGRNAKAIATKADQSALEATNSMVTDNTNRITIAEKAIVMNKQAAEVAVEEARKDLAKLVTVEQSDRQRADDAIYKEIKANKAETAKAIEASRDHVNDVESGLTNQIKHVDGRVDYLHTIIFDDADAKEGATTPVNGDRAAEVAPTAKQKAGGLLERVNQVAKSVEKIQNGNLDPSSMLGKELQSHGDKITTLEHRTSELEGNVKSVGASAAALAALKPIEYNPGQTTQVMAGVGTYRGKTAAALGLAHYATPDVMYHAGVALGGSHGTMANAGITIGFGSGETATSHANEVKALEQQVAQLTADNEQLKMAIQDLYARFNQK